MINNLVSIRRKIWKNGKGPGYYLLKKLIKLLMNPNRYYLIGVDVGSMYLKDSDDSLMNTILWSGSHYERNTIRIIKEFIKPGFAAMDVGAHIGYFSLLMGKQIGPNGAIYVFEPQSELNSQIRRTLEVNDVTNFVLEDLLLAGYEGEVLFHEAKDSGHSSISDSIIDSESVITVKKRATTLDQYCIENGIKRLDFLKLDVEGAEWVILGPGADYVLSELRPILLVEIHQQQITKLGGSVNELLNRLTSKGYEVQQISSKKFSLDLITDTTRFGDNWHLLALNHKHIKR
ncbi:MAG: FkbM family methyltransferase [Cyclobacteriaceae bacterium]|nr:FkbM family methyltransferase [Cyclobacteriaceae bacterium]